MARPLKMYFLEDRLGNLKCVIAGRPPRRQGWKVIRDRKIEKLRANSLTAKPQLEKFLQVAFGAGVSWGRNNFN